MFCSIHPPPPPPPFSHPLPPPLLYHHRRRCHRHCHSNNLTGEFIDILYPYISSHSGPLLNQLIEIKSLKITIFLIFLFQNTKEQTESIFMSDQVFLWSMLLVFHFFKKIFSLGP